MSSKRIKKISIDKKFFSYKVIFCPKTNWNECYFPSKERINCVES